MFKVHECFLFLFTATGKLAVPETNQPEEVPREFLEGDILWMYVVLCNVSAYLLGPI